MVQKDILFLGTSNDYILIFVFRQAAKAAQATQAVKAAQAAQAAQAAHAAQAVQAAKVAQALAQNSKGYNNHY